MSRGILFVTAATLCFVVMNAAVKLLDQHLPTVELIWARTLGHLIVVVALFAPGHGGWRLLATRRPAIQVGGFAEALIVIRPTGEGASPYAFLVLGSAACYALYQVLTRLVAGVDAPETSVTYSALAGTLVLSTLVPFFWRTPQRLSQWLMLAALGLLGAVGHYCVARALLWAPASIVSPFHYVQLVWAAALGYVLFGDVPTGWTWLGAAIIVGSGLSIVVNEMRRS